MATTRSGVITEYGSQTDYSTTTRKDFYDVDSLESDSPGMNKESRWTPEWTKWHGWYKIIPELRAVINKLASWTFGRGIKADAKNKAKLKKIRGNGKESSRLVLKNQWRAALICGDSFAHIIKDGQGRMTNLKPFNPGHVTIVYDEFGIISHYEKRVGINEIQRFEPEDIFHLSYERLGDEMHGIPFVESLQDLVKARNEALADLRILYHRNIKPITFFVAKTDDETVLGQVESKINEAYRKSENVVIPEDVLDSIKDTSKAQYGNLDSLNYLKFLVRLYVSACGMPEVIMGWGEETTEASASIIYLSYQQEIEDMQLYNQEMAEMQLNITFNLEFPASLEQKLQDNEAKRGKGVTTEPGKDG
jgi:hypothetical protein